MLRLFTTLAISLLLYGCATITTPTGGPKDEEAPILTSSDPKNDQTNFKGKTIELTFNELINLNNPKDEIIIIPPVGKKTNFQAKRNKVIITPEESLRENTTYTISFREGIKDLTEGNPVENQKLAFSTGPFIDTLQIEGTVAEATKEKIPEGITVALFSSDTFNIFEHTPEYFTKTAKDGKFQITNLKPGTYRLYAFEDKNKNLKLESKNERYAFKSDTIHLKKNSTKNQLRLVNLDSRPPTFTNVRAQADVNTIRFNKQVATYKLTSPEKLLSSFGTDGSEIITYYPNIESDSLQIQLHAEDSLHQTFDSLIYIKKTDKERIEESLRLSVTDPQLNTETGKITFQLIPSKIITALTLDSIYLEVDSLTKIPLEKKSFTLDTARKIINVTQQLALKKDEPEPKNLILRPSALISIEGDTSKATKKQIQSFNTESTAVLLAEVQTKAPHYIVQVVTTNYEVLAEERNKPKVTFKYLPPQNIKLRLIIDTNNNGVWDTANYLTNTEPERIIYHQTQDKKFDTPLRANWEVGPLLLKF